MLSPDYLLHISEGSEQIAEELKKALKIEISNENIFELAKHIQKSKTNKIEVALCEVKYREGKNNLVELMEFLKKEEIQYSKIYSERPTLNDVFLELTGKELRD